METWLHPYIKVTLGEDYPRILFARQMKKDKSRYFGPYTSAGAVKDTIDLINKLYCLRTCNRILPRDIGLERPCLNYHIKQCLGPCQEYVSKEEYRQQVAGALEFLAISNCTALNISTSTRGGTLFSILMPEWLYSPI